uniref:Uncharacterized protein n=1 Tax=Tanacetum cinerariifolium TaxID=118510 RepID=A0A6L2NWU9_TANCI|nr:hypothetical protein [Tanacetum cinerariifolium]
MKSLSPQVVSAAKLPILNPNEFNLWKMRFEQYFLMTDYSLWEVILNGDSPAPTRVIDGVLQPVAPTMAEQRLARKNELKDRGTLLMALPDKHQLKFNTHKDVNTLMEEIKKRFRGNTETRKLEPGTSTSFLKFPAMKQSSIKRWDEYGFVIHPVVTSLIHIESHKSPTMSLFDVDSSRISIFIVNAQASLVCSGKITRMMRRTLDSITSFHNV